MRPTVREVMDTIIWTFDEEIAPHVAEGLPKSLANTTSNLLRHVLLRMEHEGPAVTQEIAELRAVLARVRAFAAGHGELADLARRLDAAEEPAADELAVLEQLRWRLQHTIEVMQAVRSACETDETYRALREEIRDCLDRQLEREALWIDKAFTGPRR